MVHQQAVQDQLQSEQKTLKKLKKTFLIRNQKVKAKRKMTLDLIFLAEQLINNDKRTVILGWADVRIRTVGQCGINQTRVTVEP